MIFYSWWGGRGSNGPSIILLLKFLMRFLMVLVDLWLHFLWNVILGWWMMAGAGWVGLKSSQETTSLILEDSRLIHVNFKLFLNQSIELLNKQTLWIQNLVRNFYLIKYLFYMTWDNSQYRLILIWKHTCRTWPLPFFV